MLIINPYPDNDLLQPTTKHNLLVLTDHPDPRLILLEYAEGTEASEPSLRTLKALNLYERNSRPAEYVNTCLVDHKGKVAIACSYTGKLRVLELENGLISSDFDTSQVSFTRLTHYWRKYSFVS